MPIELKVVKVLVWTKVLDWLTGRPKGITRVITLCFVFARGSSYSIYIYIYI